ncbi:MAG: hypothetical protein ACXAAT_10885 [Candidatus Hodarchaeales archaeon]|jgi:hypothetical protein
MTPKKSIETIVLEEPKLERLSFFSRIKNIKNRFTRTSDQVSSRGDYPEELLQGKTIQVYWYLLTHPSRIAGIREIQRDLNLKSPGVAAYHINKLVTAGIVKKNEETEKYFVKEEVRTGFLGFYFRLGYRMIPRFSVYLIVYLIGIALFLLFSVTRGDTYLLDPSSWVFLFFIVFGIAIMVFESLNIRKMKPD